MDARSSFGIALVWMAVVTPIALLFAPPYVLAVGIVGGWLAGGWRLTAMAALVRDRLAAPGEPQEDRGGARVRKVSLRASDLQVDVSAIARVFGGGGHPAAAGFSTSLAWDELVTVLRAELDRQLDLS